MQWLDEISSHLIFTREYLKAGVFVSLLSVWVLVALFYYLNLHTKRRYFTIWTAAWLFYALWITLSFGRQGGGSENPFTMVLEQWCVGISAIFLFWGSLQFLDRRVKTSIMGYFLVFLLVWTYVGAHYLSKPLEIQMPVFGLIALASFSAGVGFFKHRRENPYAGATLLGAGFFLWGLYMASYPFLETSEDLTSVALFISAGLQLLLAVSMIILVLEEAKHSYQLALEQMEARKAERDAMESKVISSEERYRKLFDQASEAIVITDVQDARILEMNRAAERLLGISQGEVGQHLLTAFCDFKGPTGPPSTGAEWFRYLCHARPLNLVRKDGVRTPVEVAGTEIRYEGRPAHQFSLLELTERARLEQQLRQSEKLSAIGRMISGVAHELNNPLAVVKGYLELILAHHDLPPQTRADLEKAAHESNRAAKLVTNFLSFARQQPSHRESVDLNELIRKVAELRKFDLQVAKTEMMLVLEGELPAVWGDPDQIQQLLVNLMTNALQAMAEHGGKGRLRLQTRHSEHLVQVLVEDSGPGVPEELLTRIFEPFFTTKDVGTGTGLGLSIAHTIMNEHQGRVFYQQSSLGGACFVLEFPMAPPEEKERAGADDVKPAEESRRQTKPKISGGGKILVLDDERGIAEMLGEMLGLLGHLPTVCSAAAQALELVDRQNFDLIISDFRMPGMNGQEFYEIVSKKKPALARRIIFLTGDVVNEETLEFLKSTGNPHMAKPFDLASVEGAVTEAMRANNAKNRN